MRTFSPLEYAFTAICCGVTNVDDCRRFLLAVLEDQRMAALAARHNGARS